MYNVSLKEPFLCQDISSQPAMRISENIVSLIYASTCITDIFILCHMLPSWSQWLHGLGQLKHWDCESNQILLKAWMYLMFFCVVLSCVGRGLVMGQVRGSNSYTHIYLVTSLQSLQ